jgi:hypothetical protein
MTGSEFETILLKGGGAIIAMIAFWWIRRIILGKAL